MCVLLGVHDLKGPYFCDSKFCVSKELMAVSLIPAFEQEVTSTFPGACQGLCQVWRSQRAASRALGSGAPCAQDRNHFSL